MHKSSRILALILIPSLLGLTACAYRPPVQQGNVITDADIDGVHRGMSRAQIEAFLGEPVLINVFPDGRLVYVYTLEPNHGIMQERQLRIYFRSGYVYYFKTHSSLHLNPPV